MKRKKRSKSSEDTVYIPFNAEPNYDLPIGTVKVHADETIDGGGNIIEDREHHEEEEEEECRCSYCGKRISEEESILNDGLCNNCATMLDDEGY